MVLACTASTVGRGGRWQARHVGEGCAGAALGAAAPAAAPPQTPTLTPPAPPCRSPPTCHFVFPSCAAAFSSDQSIAPPFSPAAGQQSAGRARAGKVVLACTASTVGHGGRWQARHVGKVVPGRRWAAPHRPHHHIKRQSSPPPAPPCRRPPSSPAACHFVFPSCAAAFSSDQSFSPAAGQQSAGRARAGKVVQACTASTVGRGGRWQARHVTRERLCRGGAGRRRHWRQRLAAGKQAGRQAGLPGSCAARSRLQRRPLSPLPSIPSSSRPPARRPAHRWQKGRHDPCRSLHAPERARKSPRP